MAYWLLVYKEQISQCGLFQVLLSLFIVMLSSLLNCLIPAPYFMGRHFSNYHKLSVFQLQKEISKLITFEQGKTLADAEGDVFRGLRKMLAPPLKKGDFRTHREGRQSPEQLIALGICTHSFLHSLLWKEKGQLQL